MLKNGTGLFDRRLLVAAALFFAIAVAVAVVGALREDTPPPKRQDLLVMSSVPLRWGEASMSDIARGEAQPSPLYAHLARQYRLTLIDDFQTLGQPGSTVMVMVQPRALAPRELVQLDAWVRRGGQVVIFADPALDWPSALPLGDPQRPLFTSLLNPLFRHWGLELALPMAEKPDADAKAGTYALAPKSAGIWVKAKSTSASAACRVRPDEWMALCRPGKGQALLIADADLLHDTQWTDTLVSGGTLAWLDAVIAALKTGKTIPSPLWDDLGN